MSVKFTSWTQLVSLMRRRLPLSSLILLSSSPTPLTDTTGDSGPLDDVAVCICPSTHSTAQMIVLHRYVHTNSPHMSHSFTLSL